MRPEVRLLLPGGVLSNPNQKIGCLTLGKKTLRTGPLVSFRILLWLVLFLGSMDAWAMRYPQVARDEQGTWIATDQALIWIVGDLWTFYTSADGLPSDRIRRVAPDTREVWAATSHGLGRMDRNSRRWETLRAPDPLPSDNVWSIAVDDRMVWVGTDRGAVRFNKMSRTWSKVDEAQGPGDQPVFDILSLGQTVWMATASGMYLFDRQTQMWQRLGQEEGLGAGSIDEIILAGDSLWLLGQKALARFDLRSRAIGMFSSREGLPSPHIRAFASVQGEIWIGTGEGLVVYNSGSDSIGSFIHQEGMPVGSVSGIEVSLPYVWVTTDRGVGSFNTMNKTWEGKKEADGLASSSIEGVTLAGSMLALLQPDTFQGYDIVRDEWRTYAINDVWAGKTGAAVAGSKWRWNLEFTMDGEASLKHPGSGTSSAWDTTWQLFPDIRLGMGTALEDGRTLDGSVRLNVGDVSKSGILEYNAELRLRGNEKDALKELLLSDQLPIRQQENSHGLLDDAWLQGVGMYQRIGKMGDRKNELVTVEAEAGINRGVRKREFFRGSIESSFSLAHQYLTPGSEVVKVDGMILDRNVDYIITHTTGQLTFLNPDMVNALSLVEITYSYEQIPRKGLGTISLLQMLPWDNELGNFKRSGTPTYVSDEAGLYAQIDGAAPKYLDRGWVESVFQDYAQGSTTVAVQIHDMGTPEQAEEIMEYDRPISYVMLWQDPNSTALLDQSLPSGYAIKMLLERFYVEMSIDEKSKTAEILIELFAQAVRTKGDLAGTEISTLRPMVGRLRLGVNPSDHFGLGGSFLGEQDLEDRQVMDRTGAMPGWQDMLMLDGWSKHQLGSGMFGGEMSSFVQAGKSQAQQGSSSHRSGEAIVGNVLYNSPGLNLRVDGEAQSRQFDTLGTRDTALGTFENDVRVDATLSPLSWLPFRLVADREQSRLDAELANGGSGTGINQNLIGKLAFTKARWPTVWVLGGWNVLEGGGHRDQKLRGAGSLEYDLAHGVLEGLGFKKLTVRAYYDYSENEVSPAAAGNSLRWSQLGSSPGVATNLRLEIKAAPTKTEDGYARFERKTFDPVSQPAAGTLNSQRPLEAWELVTGVASRFVPGLVPTFNGKMTYTQGQTSQGATAESAQALLSGQLELFPGRWIGVLGTTRMAAGYGFTNGEESESGAMKTHLRKDQVDGAVSYGKYDDTFRVESRGKWWKLREGEKQAESEQYLEVLNRVTYRPVYVSPVSMRFDISDLKQLQELQMGRVRQYSPSVEWERRWSLDFVTKVRLEVPIRSLNQFLDEATGHRQNGEDWSLKPWEEVRLRLANLWRQTLLRLTLRGYQQTIIGNGRDLERALELYTSLWLDWEKAGSFILRIGVGHTWHRCLELRDFECRSYHVLSPSLKAIARF